MPNPPPAGGRGENYSCVCSQSCATHLIVSVRPKPCITFNGFPVAWKFENNIYLAKLSCVRRGPKRSYSGKLCRNIHKCLQLQMEQEWVVVIHCLVKVCVWQDLSHGFFCCCFGEFFFFNGYLCFFSLPIHLMVLPCAEQRHSAMMSELFIYKVERKQRTTLRCSWRCWQKTSWNSATS